MKLRFYFYFGFVFRSASSLQWFRYRLNWTENTKSLRFRLEWSQLFQYIFSLELVGVFLARAMVSINT